MNEFFEEGPAIQAIGSGGFGSLALDTRKLYPDRAPNPAIVRRLVKLYPLIQVEWDRKRGRWVLYDYDAKYVKFPGLAAFPNWIRPRAFQESEALILTWQHPDGSFRDLDEALVKHYEKGIWRMKHFAPKNVDLVDTSTPGAMAVEYDKELTDAKLDLHKRAQQAVLDDAYTDFKERYPKIKNNADRHVWFDPPRERRRFVGSFPERMRGTP